MAVVATSAFAQDCNAPGSNAEQTLCAFARAREAHARMLERFDYAVRMAKRFSETMSVEDVGPELRAVQGEWQAWMERQCRLEGDITLGSAAGRAEAACIERLVRERIETLDKLAERLNL